MRQEWVKYLCDPIDKTSLKIDNVIAKKGRDILFGTLKSKSGNVYAIKEGVPILLNHRTQSTETVDSFAHEWKGFDFDYGKNGWVKDIVRPVLGGTKYFKNKIIIDCGSGSGRQSQWMAEAGAKFIFCIELSDAARTIVKKVTNRIRNKVFVIQADIAHIPINTKNVKVDLVYCINVIQHTKNPKSTMVELSRMMGKNTDLLFNIYLQKGRKYLLSVLNCLRKITRYVPYSLLKYFCFVVAVVVYPVSLLPFSTKHLSRFVPVSHGFKETWLDIYDLLGSHEYQKFYTEKELCAILNKAKLKMVKRTRYAFLLKKKIYNDHEGY